MLVRGVNGAASGAAQAQPLTTITGRVSVCSNLQSFAPTCLSGAVVAVSHIAELQQREHIAGVRLENPLCLRLVDVAPFHNVQRVSGPGQSDIVAPTKQLVWCDEVTQV